VATVELRVRGGASLRCELADSFWRRFFGLMGRSGVARGEGLLFVPGGAIHTAFMRFEIDAVFIARDGTVVRVAERVPPWRFRAAGREARFLVELAGGESARLGLIEGSRLDLADGLGDWSMLAVRRR